MTERRVVKRKNMIGSCVTLNTARDKEQGPLVGSESQTRLPKAGQDLSDR